MHIDQHNYEEFFLLYVDGELSATDKQTVDQFVQANPGLAVELEMLLQMRLTDEEPVLFEGKESLFRNEAAEINLQNHEEQFLLYVDNELDEVSKEKVETFVLQHPALQESFTLLKQTRLEPEAIVFSDKSSLYRKEEKENPVFYLRWQRIAVAAALIGFAVLVWTVLPSDTSSKGNTAKLELKTDVTSPKNTNGTVASTNTDTKILPKENSTTLSSTATVQPALEKNNADILSPIVNTNNLIANDVSVQNNTETVSGGLKKEDIISNPVEPVEKPQFSQKIPSGNASLANADMVKVNHSEDAENNEEIIHQTVYRELDTDDEKKSLYLGSLEINKDKLRGFFRKAGSIFRSKLKAEDEKTDSRPVSNSRSLK
jgi:anti-sigma factor RsiW